MERICRSDDHGFGLTLDATVVAVAFLTVLMSLVEAAPATAASKYLPTVSPVKQANSNWCWAASSQMVIRHFAGTASQQAVVNFIYPGLNYPNRTGSLAQTDAAIDAYCWEPGMIRSGSLSWSAVLFQTNSGGPVVTGWRWYGGGGHMVVCRGYDDQAAADYVYWCDPADGLGHKNTYAWFKDNGVHAWAESIFYK